MSFILDHLVGSHSHRGFSPVVSTQFRNDEPFQRFPLLIAGKAVETAILVSSNADHRAEATV